MLFNIHAGWTGVLLAVASLWPVRARAQVSCPTAAAEALENAWLAYRADSNEVAADRFATAVRLCPQSLDAAVGLGFSWLRLGRASQADSTFRSALARAGQNSDAWEGRARSALRLGDTATAVSAAQRSLDLAPANRELRAWLERIPSEWRRSASARPRPDTLQLFARARGRQFEVNPGAGWRPFYLRGVNLGVALPGRYPSDFPPDSATYAGWMDTLAAMGANTLRVYTILPPAFYRALRGWNLNHRDRLLWLMHGVWAELPPQHDFADPRWEGEFQAEMRRVVDVIHGSANLLHRRGHASGRYDADVSHWVSGYILGREWEPFAVRAFDSRRPSGAYNGRYLKVRQGPAMDLWLARQCDVMLAYEVDTYNALRPIAYTNWPTLDPLTHPTEATTAEESFWRRKSGRRTEAKKLEYENDAIGIDANLVQPTPENPAGWFASYHAYPYYPDFMLLDPGYSRARSTEGPSNYFGYLKQLIAYHRDIPTVIAEYGVPSSRGIAHLQPQGWHHGGHDEQAMAAIDARLTREIREAGAAGAILFAWMDEWFKKNWAVIDYEIPLDNTRLWHNMMDVEQNYGILGQYAGMRATTPRLGGDPKLWHALPTADSANTPGALIQRLRLKGDESFLYMAVELASGGFDWRGDGIQLAIDTYLPVVGQHRLPQTGVASEIGFEFLIDLASPDSGFLRVTPDYQRHDARLDPVTGDDFGRFSRRPVLPRDRTDARFEPLFIIVNRARFGRDGRFYPAQGYDRGRLRYGREVSSTLADWYLDRARGLLQIRIPWDLLNVTDPASRTLLFDPRTEGKFGTAQAQDFHIGVLIYRKRPGPEVLGSLPRLQGNVWKAEGFRGWRWEGWSAPGYYSRLKPVYDSLKTLWREDPSGAPGRPARPAP